MREPLLAAVLQSPGTIAVVGLSADETRASHRVARYLLAQGCDVVPVNPQYDRILGMRSFPTLAAVDRSIALVDVFRRAEECLTVAEQAIACGARVLWLQQGIRNAAAETLAESRGLVVVADRCLMVDYAAHRADRGLP